MASGGLGAEQVGRAIHPHPTQSELFGDLARRLHSRLQRGKKRAKAYPPVIPTPRGEFMPRTPKG